MKKNLIGFWRTKKTEEKAYLIMAFIVLAVLFLAALFYARLSVLHAYFKDMKYAAMTGVFSIVISLSFFLQVHNIKKIVKPKTETEEESKESEEPAEWSDF